MISRLLACLLALASGLSAEAAFKPVHVLSLSGTASLSRLEGEAWPLEAGQDLPANVALRLEKGAFLSLRLFGRVDLLVSGPAQAQFSALTQAAGGAPALGLKLQGGDYYLDPRFLLGRPSRIVLSLPEGESELKSGLPFMLALHAPKATLRENVDPAKKLSQPWPAAFLAAATEPVPVLLLCRDYDKELKLWPRPAVLGPAMLAALSGLKGLRVVEGSGSTVLAYFANHALRSGQDFFLQQMGREHGARFVLAGNLVSEELREESPSLRRKPLMAAAAELRVLEAGEQGEVLVSDMATTLCARAGRPLEIAGREALEGAAARAGAYLRADFEQLLAGQAHAPQLLKVAFNGVSEARQRELRRALSGMDSVQRYFRRAFASGVLKIDVVLRRSQDDFMKQLQACAFDGFSLEPGAQGPEGGLVFTLRSKAP